MGAGRVKAATWRSAAQTGQIEQSGIRPGAGTSRVGVLGEVALGLGAAGAERCIRPVCGDEAGVVDRGRHRRYGHRQRHRQHCRDGKLDQRRQQSQYRSHPAGTASPERPHAVDLKRITSLPAVPVLTAAAPDDAAATISNCVALRKAIATGRQAALVGDRPAPRRWESAVDCRRKSSSSGGKSLLV